MDSFELPITSFPVGLKVGDRFEVSEMVGDKVVIKPVAMQSQDFNNMTTAQLENFLVNQAKTRSYTNPPPSINPNPQS